MDKTAISSLVNAIPVRKSVRTFMPQPLPDEKVAQLLRFASELEAPFEHSTRFMAFQAEPGKKLYNNGVNPVNNLTVMAQTDLVSVSKAGFVGELVMLYAVSMGLSTCWFGHYKLTELGRYVSHIASPEQIKQSTMGYGYGRATDVGERAICCMPFGHKNQQTKRLVDFVAGKNGANRKQLEQLMERPEMAFGLNSALRAAMDLARLAPSAANSQFWRFGVEADGKIVSVAKPVGYKHFKWEHPDADIGMCAAHLWLGLMAQGLMPTVGVHLDQDRAMWTFTL